MNNIDENKISELTETESQEEEKEEEKKEKKEIVYKTVEETIIVTNEEVDQEWINLVNEKMREEATLSRKERYHCYRLDIADDKDEWVASSEYDPFRNLCRMTPAQERARLYRALQKLNDKQKRLVEYVYFKGYSLKEFAEMEGVDPSAVTRRHQVIIKKIKKLF